MPFPTTGTPTDRENFKNYCLRRIGAPVNQINVDDTQVEERISDALQMWADYHYDGTEKLYYKYQLTQTDIDNKYITLPENIIGAVRIFPIGQALSSSSIFSARYQFVLNNLFDLTYAELAPYYMTMMYFQEMEQLLVGNQRIRFNRHQGKLYLDMDWGTIQPGDWVIVEAYGVIDPETYSDAWNDRWLKEYATQLIKRQFGENITKFKNQKLLGGIEVNGDKIYADADREVKRLEQELIWKYSAPLEFYEG